MHGHDSIVGRQYVEHVHLGEDDVAAHDIKAEGEKVALGEGERVRGFN